jgi:sec-independent protein translocase protein TatB
MTEVGFFEIILIGIIALIVIGPERLPGLARTAGMWVGRARRMVSNVKKDIEKEIEADELKRKLKELEPDSLIEKAGLDESYSAASFQEIIDDTKKDFADVKKDMTFEEADEARPATPEDKASAGGNSP